MHNSRPRLPELQSSLRTAHTYVTISYKKPEIMVRLYKTLVRPHLEYSVSAWSPHYIKDKELLERVQHRFTRMIKEVRGKDYLKALDILGKSCVFNFVVLF